MGLVPSSTRSGDLVYIIRNTLHPFPSSAKRENPWTFQAHREAYVHGLIYREVFDLTTEDKFRTVKLD